MKRLTEEQQGWVDEAERISAEKIPYQDRISDAVGHLLQRPQSAEADLRLKFGYLFIEFVLEQNVEGINEVRKLYQESLGRDVPVSSIRYGANRHMGATPIMEIAEVCGFQTSLNRLREIAAEQESARRHQVGSPFRPLRVLAAAPDALLGNLDPA